MILILVIPRVQFCFIVIMHVGGVSQSVDVKPIISCIKEMIDANFADLKHLFENSFDEASAEMVAAGLISKATRNKQSYDAIITDFYLPFSFMKKLSEVQQHCKKFFEVFQKIGGPFVTIGDSLKQDITQIIHKKHKKAVSFN